MELNQIFCFMSFLDFSKIDWVRVLQLLVILYFSISFHECAHAWMANKCGDDTARLMGRMTLNPIVHIDIFGTVIIPLIMVFVSPFIIGWAKPVPVNPLRFKKYRQGELLVSAAGPGSNLLLVVVGIVIGRVMLTVLRGSPGLEQIFMFFYYFVWLNMFLCIFNLIPVHPLDGSHILKVFLSRSSAEVYDKFISVYGWIVLLIIVFSGVLRPIYTGAMIIALRLMGVPA